MERLNPAILNQSVTIGPSPLSHRAHPPAAAGSFFHPKARVTNSAKDLEPIVARHAD